MARLRGPGGWQRLALATFALAGVLAAACGGGGVPPGSGSTSGGAVAVSSGGLGVIAYVATDGCVIRVAAQTGASAGPKFCAPSKAGVTAITWIDEDSAAFATAESRALGWQKVDFSSGVVSTMNVADAPRVFLIPPQSYSSRGERLSIDGEGVVTRSENGETRQIWPPEGQSPDRSTRVVSWSPNADWVLLSTSTDKELWMVGRNGESPRQIAGESKGVASWFMPQVGATPHADLTCSVTTAESFKCSAALRFPVEGAVIPGGTVDFSWSTCPGATGYELVISVPATGQEIVREVQVGTFYHKSAAELPSGPIEWKVRAIIGPVVAPWSEARMFKVGGAEG